MRAIKNIGLVLILGITLLVSGCSNSSELTEVKGATVTKTNTKGAYTKQMIIEKNGQELTLSTSKSVHSAVKVGTVVDVKFDNTFRLKEIDFPLIEEKSKEKEK